jgi:hypothetical protein
MLSAHHNSASYTPCCERRTTPSESDKEDCRLQSFQPKASNDFRAAYVQYGDRLAFATGIDTQRGETMTPQELRREILENYAIGKTHGRHILGTTHVMQYSMPMENLQAILGTVQEIQAGLHD